MDSNAINIFILYANEDEALKEELISHLSTIPKHYAIKITSSQHISLGSSQVAGIKRHMEAAHIILLLISPDFIRSKYEEMQQAIQRYRQEKTPVIAVILRHSDYTGAPFEQLETILPTHNRPIREWIDRDQAFADVIRGIRRIVETLHRNMHKEDPLPETPFSLEHRQDEVSYYQRRDAEEAYIDLLRNDQHWLLLITGFPGSGKTTLLRWFEQHTTEDIATPTFLTFAETYDYKRLFRELNARIQPLLVQKEADEALDEDDEANEEPEVPQSQTAQHDRSGNLNLRAVSEMTRATERERQIEIFLDHLKDCYNASPELKWVLLWDAFEKLPEEERQWTWKFLEDAHTTLPGLKVVIASQHLTGEEPGDAKEIALSHFSAADSDAFLQQMGVTDPAFRSAIHRRVVHGHPLLLRWAVDIWKTAEKTHQLPTASDIPDYPLQKTDEAIQWIRDRIAIRLEQPLANVVRWGVLLRSFKLDSINAILAEENEEFTENHWLQLREYSFIKPVAKEEGAYAFHYLMRTSLKDERRTTSEIRYENIQRRAYTYFIAKDYTNREYTISALYHHFQFAPEQALEEWNCTRKEAYQKHNYFLLEALIKLVDATHEHDIYLNEEQRAFVTLKAAHFYRRTYKYEQSLTAYQATLEFYDTPANHNSEASGYIHVIRAKHGLGVLMGITGEYEKARCLFQQLVNEYSRENDSYVFTAWGQLEAKKGDQKTAREKFKRALDIDATHIHALNAWASYELTWHNYAKANELVRTALDLSNGDMESDDRTTSLVLAARLAHVAGDITGAQKLYEQIEQNGITNADYLYYRALLQREARDNIKARELFNRLREYNPNQIVRAINWAMMEYQHPEGDIDFARQIFNEVIQNDSEHIKALELWARSEWARSNYKEASELFKRILDVEPNNISTLWNSARLAEKQEKLGLASHFLQRILDIHEYVPALNAKARIERAHGNLKEAAELLERARHGGPGALSTLYMQALIEKDPVKKRELLKKVVKSAPKHVPALMQLAHLEREFRDFQQAEQLLDRAIRVDPQHAAARYERAVIARNQDQLEKAEELFQNVLQLDSRYLTRAKRIQTLRALAKVKWQQDQRVDWKPDQYEEARALFKEVLTIAPNSINTLQEWAYRERSIGNEEGVQHCIEEALKVESIDDIRWLTKWALQESLCGNKTGARDLFKHAMDYKVEGHLVAMFAHFEYTEGNYDDARTLFDQARVLLPRDATNFVNWAIMEFKQGDIEKARDLFRNALDINPAAIQTLDIWARLEWSSALRDRRERAANLFAEILSIDPNNINALWDLAKLRSRQGKLKEAADLLHHILALNTDHVADALHELSNIESKRGNQAKARDFAEQAQRIRPDAQSTSWVWRQALNQFTLRNYRKTQEILLRITQSAPRHLGAWKLLALLERKRALIERKAEHYQKAAEHYRRAEEYLQEAYIIDPEHISVLEDLATLRKIRGKPDKAIEYLARIVNLCDDSSLDLPKKIRAWRLWADIEWKREHYTEARALFEQIFARKPDNMNTFLVLARKERSLTQNEERVQALISRACSLDHIDDIRWLTRWAKEENQHGNRAGARQLFEYAAKLTPDARLLAEFALFESQEHHYEQARTLFERAWNLKPADAMTEEWAAMEYNLGDIETARSYFELALDNNPPHTVRILERWARLEEEHLYYSEAAHLYARIATTEPENISALSKRARLEMTLGHEVKAKHILQHIRNIDPRYKTRIQFESFWKPIAAEEKHYQIVADKGTLQAVLATSLFLVKGCAHITITQKAAEKPFEAFIARCLLELGPCTAEQIASFLKLKAPFVWIILKQFQQDQLVIRTEDDLWHVNNPEQLQLFLEKHSAVNTRKLQFMYEWKKGIFLPATLKPETWPTVQVLDELPVEELDTQFAMTWARKTLESQIKGDIHWETYDYRSAWVFPLEIIVYKPVSQPRTWTVAAPQPELHNDLRTIAQLLDIVEHLKD